MKKLGVRGWREVDMSFAFYEGVCYGRDTSRTWASWILCLKVHHPYGSLARLTGRFTGILEQVEVRLASRNGLDGVIGLNWLTYSGTNNAVIYNCMVIIGLLCDNR